MITSEKVKELIARNRGVGSTTALIASAKAHGGTIVVSSHRIKNRLMDDDPNLNAICVSDDFRSVSTGPLLFDTDAVYHIITESFEEGVRHGINRSAEEVRKSLDSICNVGMLK